MSSLAPLGTSLAPAGRPRGVFEFANVTDFEVQRTKCLGLVFCRFGGESPHAAVSGTFPSFGGVVDVPHAPVRRHSAAADRDRACAKFWWRLPPNSVREPRRRWPRPGSPAPSPPGPGGTPGAAGALFGQPGAVPPVVAPRSTSGVDVGRVAASLDVQSVAYADFQGSACHHGQHRRGGGAARDGRRGRRRGAVRARARARRRQSHRSRRRRPRAHACVAARRRSTPGNACR